MKRYKNEMGIDVEEWENFDYFRPSFLFEFIKLGAWVACAIVVGLTERFWKKICFFKKHREHGDSSIQ